MTASLTDRVMLVRQIDRARSDGDWATVEHFERRLRGMGEPVRAGAVVHAQMIAALYAACWRALRLARVYARDHRSSGRDFRECVNSVMRRRREIATLRREVA